MVLLSSFLVSLDPDPGLDDESLMEGSQAYQPSEMTPSDKMVENNEVSGIALAFIFLCPVITRARSIPCEDERSHYYLRLRPAVPTNLEAPTFPELLLTPSVCEVNCFLVVRASPKHFGEPHGVLDLTFTESWSPKLVPSWPSPNRFKDLNREFWGSVSCPPDGLLSPGDACGLF
jgi:hypothetical protein